MREGFKNLRSVWFHEDLLAGHGPPRGWVQFEIFEIWLWCFRPIQLISGWNVAPRDWVVVFDCSRFVSIDICITLIVCTWAYGYGVCVCFAIRISSGGLQGLESS